MKSLFFTCIALISQIFLQAQNSIIPLPRNFSQSDEIVYFDPSTVLFQGTQLRAEALFLAHELNASFEFRLPSVIEVPSRQFIPEGPKIKLLMIRSDSIVQPGTYWLYSDKTGTTITAIDNLGIFYGIQSLLQLIRKNGNRAELNATQIQGDYPNFRYRGMHLDVCRHFFPVNFVKKYIDLMAIHKMNYFHWHLTEDQGWRIEIKKYPKLTEVGAWRNGSMVGPYSDQKFDNIRYGGYYTQEEIKEVVKYAAERHIQVIPEIEMPGHALAALAAYPEYSCTGGPFEVAKGWGVFDDVYCPKEETFAFLEDILDEVCELFPAQYIHIGGDECPKTRWKSCPNCQKRIREQGLKDEHELQSYFIQRIEKYLNAKGKKIIGWDEILEGGLAPNATVMSWRGTEGGIAAAKLMHDVIMTPGSHCYFDHYQAKKETEPHAIGGFTPLEKVFEFKPVPSELNNQLATYIIGAQANVWTEYMTTTEHVEYMVIPRISALAEVLWTGPGQSNYKDFKKRLAPMLMRLEEKGYNYRKLD
jgi:hexosaminidase